MSHCRRALSLLEVLVGGTILMVVTIAMFGALGTTAREVQTTADHTVALLLSQRVAEEVLQAPLENPYAREALSELAGKLSIVGHPLFEVVEDSQAPWGRLVAGSDLGVKPADANLFRLYRQYELQLEPQDLPTLDPGGFSTLMQRVDIAFAWPAAANATRSSLLQVTVANPVVSPLSPPALLDDLPGLDQAIARLLYPDFPELDLTASVQRSGGELAMVRELGTVAAVIQNTLERRDAITDTIGQELSKIQAARVRGRVDEALIHGKLGALLEERAAVAWQALLITKDPAWRLSGSLTASGVGTKSAAGLLLRRLLKRAGKFKSDLGADTSQALASYRLAVELIPSLTELPFWKLTVERKVIDLSKLELMLGQTSDIRPLIAWIAKLEEAYQGRNRLAAHGLKRERTCCTSVEAIQANHPKIGARLRDAEEATRSLSQLAARVRTVLVVRDRANKTGPGAGPTDPSPRPRARGPGASPADRTAQNIPAR